MRMTLGHLNDRAPLGRARRSSNQISPRLLPTSFLFVAVNRGSGWRLVFPKTSRDGLGLCQELRPRPGIGADDSDVASQQRRGLRRSPTPMRRL